MYNILIFGTGSSCEKLKGFLDYSKVRILAYIDNNQIKQGIKIDGIRVIPPKYIHECDYDYILIASQYYKEIKEQLKLLGVNDSKIYYLYQEKCYHPQVVKFLHSKESFDGLVTGISYAEYGIDTSIFSRNIFNFGLSSQDLFFDYSIIKYCLRNFPQKMITIKYALIVLEYYSFDYEIRERRDFNEKYFNIYEFLNEDVIDIFNQDFMQSKYNRDIAEKHDTLKNMLLNIKVCEHDLGQYYKQINRLKKEFNKNFPNSVSINKEIFLKYIKLLKHYGVYPVVVICPQNKYIREIVSNETITKFYNLINEISQQYDFQVLDYFNNSLFELSDFYDISHLNKYGANKLTQLLESDIKWE